MASKNSKSNYFDLIFCMDAKNNIMYSPKNFKKFLGSGSIFYYFSNTETSKNLEK